LVFIEGGTFVMGNPEQDITYSWNAIKRRVTVSSFYMDETEISNVDYREYLHWLSIVFREYPQVINKAKPDTLVWRRPLGYNEPYVNYYFRYPAFNDYPVVGVNWVQACDYSSWRTDRVNEKILIDAGVLQYNDNPQAPNYFTTDAYLAGLYNGQSTGKYKDSKGNPRRITLEDGLILPHYRLPTEAEWEFAAYALIGNTQDERIYAGRIYPWNGHYLRNPDRAYRGLFMANFKRGRGDYMGVAGYLNDGYAPTAPVDAFWPNDYGLYNMAGNVNEWVLDVYRPLSYVDFDDFNPFRGNVFKTLVRNKDGSVVDRDSLGRLRYRLMGEDPSKYGSDMTAADVKNELKRYNYQKADNRNYLDGDLQSTLGPTWLPDQADFYKGTNTMYNYEGYDKNHDGATSLITDESRVYKGGSWRDMPYWLVPGTRRFLNQYRSTDDIGFRCAMIHLGPPSMYERQ
jgi:gliding motility-associated lipoprotein GldJ